MRFYVLLVACLFIAIHVSGQENNTSNKITLITGEVYVGKIVLKTNEMIMIATKDGTRYQFQLAEVAKIESEASSDFIKTEIKTDVQPVSKSGFGGLVELTSGFSNAKYCFGWQPNTQLSLLFGNKNSFGGNVFLGAGIGYNTTYRTDNNSTVSFLPAFVRIQRIISKKRTSPFVGMDAGYAFAINSNYGGGVSIRISVGITRRISYKASLNVGAYAGVQSISTNLTEINQFGTYSYYGKTTMNNAGVKVGLMF